MMKYRAVMMNSIGTLTVCFLLLYTLSCSTPEPYIIGFLGGFTGGLSDLTIAGRNGVILATEDFNRAGGIAGRTAELVIKDDKDDPEAAQQSIAFFEEKSVVGIVGPMTSEMSRAAAPVAHKEKIVMISPTANSADFSIPGGFFFRVSPSDRDEAQLLAELAFQKRGYERISILYDLSNREYAENRVQYFRKFIEDFGGIIAQVTSYTTRDDTDYGLLVSQVSQNNPDAVYILTGGSDLSRICRELKKQGSTLPVLADGWAVTPEVIRQSGAAAEGIEFFQSYDLNNTAARYQDFLLNYRARFHEEPEFGAFYAYESAVILLSALEQADSKRNLNNIIHEIKRFKGLQDALEIDQDGVAQRPLYHKRIENGAIVSIAAD
jgi:branched-chain amino acid transport system substrate-binding protein